MGRTTVTTTLYDGKYDGPQVSTLFGEGCSMYVIPRKDLKFISSHDEMKKPALYVLIGSESGSPAAYIGQTDDFSHRIKDHDYKKPFWTIALAFMREGNPLTSNDVKYLEYLGYKAAVDVGTYSTGQNKQDIKEPTVNQWEEDSNCSFFEKCRFLADFRGYHVFTKVTGTVLPPPQRKMFTLRCRLTEARGYIDGDGFVVVKDSRIDPAVTKWLAERASKEKERNDLLSSNATMADGVWVLERDIPFESAHMAGVFCVAGSVNAMKVWKDEENRPLSDFIKDMEQS